MAKSKLNPEAPVTNKTLWEAVDALLNGMQEIFQKQNKRFTKIENTQTYIKDSVDGIKADISTMPTRQEFEQLKKRITN